MVWLSFDAMKVVHRVTLVTEGIWHSVTLYTPGKLEHLTSEDWERLGKLGFPIYLCNAEFLQARRLVPQDPPRAAAQSSEVAGKVSDQEDTSARVQVNPAISSEKPQEHTDPFQNTPLPSIADEEEPRILDLKTLLECCRCALSFNQAHGLPVGSGNAGAYYSRVREYSAMLQEELKELCETAEEGSGRDI